MAKSKQKFYVVWAGLKPGVFATWEECRRQVIGVAGSRYKAFPTRAEAETAFRNPPEEHLGPRPGAAGEPKPGAGEKSGAEVRSRSGPILESVAVDAAWNTETGVMEYRGVETATGQELFREGPYDDGTNNVGEFLAIVHGLAYLQKHNRNIPLYSDSRTAIAWVRKRKANTTLKPTGRNARLFELVARAERWLSAQEWKTRILKWETEYWGENPADFGRK